MNGHGVASDMFAETRSAQSIVIYRDILLPPSETFIQAQAASLRAYTPYFVGSRRVEGLAIPAGRAITLNNGGAVGYANELLYKATGIAPRFERAIRETRPVMIHAHYGPGGVWALPLARAMKVPLLTTIHGYDATVKDDYLRRTSRTGAIYLRRRGQLIEEGYGFIAVSEFIRGKMIEKGFPPEKILVHYIGVDTERFRPEPDVDREPVVLFVGRLMEEKGCQYLLRAMGEVVRAVPEVRVVVIGDGPMRAELEAQAEQIEGDVQFLGWRSHDEVRGWMNRARVFCAPTFTIASGDSEGLGMVFAEAQAMALPVVSFATGGIPEVVIDEETGFLAPPEDWEPLATHIQRLLVDEALWRRMSAASRRHIEERFDLAKQARELECVYAAVLREPDAVRAFERLGAR